MSENVGATLGSPENCRGMIRFRSEILRNEKVSARQPPEVSVYATHCYGGIEGSRPERKRHYKYRASSIVTPAREILLLPDNDAAIVVFAAARVAH